MFTRTKNDAHKSSVRNILIANVGDTTVKFDGLRIREANIAQNINIGQLQPNNDLHRCERRGFKIVDCQDTNRGQENNNQDNRNPSLPNGFTLRPREARRLQLMYTFDCTFKSMYVSLVLDYAEDSNQSSKHRDLELLLGYDLDPSEVKFCITNQEQGFKAYFDSVQQSLGHKRKVIFKTSILKITSFFLQESGHGRK